MEIVVDIETSPDHVGLPIVRIKIPGESTPCIIRADYAMLGKICSSPSPAVLDLLNLAMVVYAVDRSVLRQTADDSWTRQITLTLPVFLMEQWQRANPILNKCLSFLTGDLWKVDFTQNTLDPILGLRSLPIKGIPQTDAVSLFSGGLDSLIGVIDWLEQHQRGSLLLVGHHDPRIAGPYTDQVATYKDLQPHYQRRTHPLFFAVGANFGWDTTLRSRSLLFMALGLYVANSISSKTPLLVPENGNMALNVPLTPSRRGSCSTRTVHPYYLLLLRRVIEELGILNPIENPLELKTKGECVTDCLNLEVLKSTLGDTASCAKRGHKRTWVRRHARECGRCLPCIYRRAGLHTANLDYQTYGSDICTGEVNLLSDYMYANDFRALVSFLRQNLLEEEISKLLLSNGSLELDRLSEYSGLIKRAMGEVRRLINDKGITEVKQQIKL